MTGRSLNEIFLPGNTCFGCGLANPMGLGAKFFRDQKSSDRILGTFDVPPHATGLPGFAHGGAVYTALDCLAAWVTFILRSNRKFIPVGQSSTITYHKPARAGQRLTLVGTIAREGPKQGDPVVVHGEIRDSNGVLLAEGDFTLLLLPVTKFKKVAGIDQLPEDFARHFDQT
ncbi:MAG: PaaI family thioesterase [Deltaproteobacteria bacterium]|nr:PaaI family thioesterase [Deltaproteobacteria bacterium]MBW2339791.1 PaaI family thioesterase [Deltaproteobacteria bacterium]